MIKKVIKVALNSVLLMLVIIPLNFLISCSDNKNTSAGGVGPKPDKEEKKSDKEGKKPDEENFKRKYKDWFDRHSKNNEDVKKVDDVEKKMMKKTNLLKMVEKVSEKNLIKKLKVTRIDLLNIWKKLYQINIKKSDEKKNEKNKLICYSHVRV